MLLHNLRKISTPFYTICADWYIYYKICVKEAQQLCKSKHQLWFEQDLLPWGGNCKAIRVVFWKFTQLFKNFTRPPVAAVAPNINSVWAPPTDFISRPAWPDQTCRLLVPGRTLPRVFVKTSNSNSFRSLNFRRICPNCQIFCPHFQIYLSWFEMHLSKFVIFLSSSHPWLSSSWIHLNF